MILRASSSARFLSTLRNRSNSLPHHKQKPDNWNTNHSFVRSNPLLALLEKCKSITQLLHIQTQMTTTGLIRDPLALSRLIAFCAVSESRDLRYCYKLIVYNADNVNVFSWNVLIRGFLENQRCEDCVFLYKELLRRGKCIPDNYTYPLLFKACGGLGLSFVGDEVLSHVVKLGFDCDVFVHNGVLSMLVCCGRLRDARKVFDESSVRDLVSWNCLINGYVRCDEACDALRIFQEMVEIGEVEPDEVTMIGVVSACGQLMDLEMGRYFHRFSVVKGVKLTIPLVNVLMDMYVKCGELNEAKILFDGMEMKTVVSWTTIVAGYAKLGFFETARLILDQMPEKDVAPWNAVISGYVQAKRCKEALALFHEMQSSDVKPDEVTMGTCLSACTQLGALEVGIWIHQYIDRNNLSLTVPLATALIDMYMKCGNITKALQVFNQVPAKNSLTWTALICGLALHGRSRDVLTYFSQMTNAGLAPDEITFLGLLTACCHGGLVRQGRELFSKMTNVYKLSPKLKHYSCMVDLLGKAGLLEEAEELINSMPMRADAVVWTGLFSACRMHKNIVLGEKAGLKLLELDPHDSGTYVSLACMYGEANMWEHARNVWKLMKYRGVEKTPGCSSIEVNGSVYEFIVRDKTHPRSDDIYNCLFMLTSQLKPVGNASSSSLDLLVHDYIANTKMTDLNEISW